MHHFKTNEVICFSEHILILGYIMYPTSLNKLKYIYVSSTPQTMNTRRLDLKFFVAQIHIQLPKKIFGSCINLIQGQNIATRKKTIPRWIFKKTNLFRISGQIFIPFFTKKVHYYKIIMITYGLVVRVL